MDTAAAARTAALLGAARLAAQPVPDIPEADRPPTADDAYAVQTALGDYLETHGQGPQIGWKIGATTGGMQAYLGVDGPAYGRIRERGRIGNGSTVPGRAFHNPGIECEIAVVIGRDVSDPAIGRDDIAHHVAAVFPAIEIVENRYGDFLARGAPTLIADDFFHKAIVAGPEIPDWTGLDLAALHGRTLVDGIEKGSGTGADVMGHPLEAVAWLARTLAAQGLGLTAGQVVLTGSVAPVIWLENMPCDAAIEFDALGRVSIAFA